MGLVAYVMMLVAALGNITYAVMLLLNLTYLNIMALYTFSALQSAAIIFGGVLFLIVKELTSLDELAQAVGIVLIITGAISFMFVFLFAVAIANVFATVAFFKCQLPVERKTGETDIEAKEILRNLGMS